MSQRSSAERLARMEKAKVLRKTILGIANRHWQYERKDGVNYTLINHRDGWRAFAWGSSTLPMILYSSGVTREIFLNECRELNCPHTLSVWVPGYQKALSIEWTGTRMNCSIYAAGDGKLHILDTLPLAKRCINQLVL